MTVLMAWLVPAAGPARDHLAATIGTLAAEHGTPRFEPHVTIAGRFHSGEQAAVRALTSITAGGRPFEVRFAAAGHEQAYFRALCAQREHLVQRRPHCPITRHAGLVGHVIVR